jgi:hypothetical protein
MPYIPKDDKKSLDRSIAHISTELRKGDFRGRLNYTISSIFSNLLQSNGASYALINDFIGVLECAKMEAYRRVAVPYEDGKISANGDIYPPANTIQTHCLDCSEKSAVFSKNGLCLTCVMKEAGFVESEKVITRQDIDIEELANTQSEA